MYRRRRHHHHHHHAFKTQMTKCNHDNIESKQIHVFKKKPIYEVTAVSLYSYDRD